jgi:SRSO17 transposase
MEARFEARKREIEKDATLDYQFTYGAEKRLQRFATHYSTDLPRSESRHHFHHMLEGLLVDLPKKNIENIAYYFRQDRSALQYFIGSSPWDHQPIRQQLAQEIAQTIGEPDGILAFDPSGFEKCGKSSAGVARQWLGRFGKIDNGQVGTFLAYVTKTEHALCNAKLFIPEEWNKDPQRCERVHIPKKEYEKHKTRQEQCLEMLDEQGHLLPHRWITGDDELGRPSSFRRELRKRNENYVLAVPSNTMVRTMPEGIPNKEFTAVHQWKDLIPDQAGQEFDLRAGEKGPLKMRLWSCPVLAKTESGKSGNGELELLVISERRQGEELKYDYYLCNVLDTPLEELGRVILGHHRVEDCFRRLKSECGLADYEVRTWQGWHHHVTLSMLAGWFLVTEMLRAKKKGQSALSFPIMRRLLSERFYCRRYREDVHWRLFAVERQLLRREQAYFYHYYSQHILPTRRQHQQY